MPLRFAVLFNEVIFALSGSFVLVEGMTSVFHLVFQGAVNTQKMCFFHLITMASTTEQTAELFKPFYSTKITNILHYAKKI